MRSARSPAGISIRRCRSACAPAAAFPAALLLPYIVAQVVGGVARRRRAVPHRERQPELQPRRGFASNGYGAHSPGGYSLAAGLVCEVVMTFMFLIVILGTTHKRAPVGFAGLAIGLALTLIHLISIPVTNTSVNPARSTGTAVFVGGLGDSAAVDVLDRAGDWRRLGGHHLPGGVRGRREPPVTGRPR